MSARTWTEAEIAAIKETRGLQRDAAYNAFCEKLGGSKRSRFAFFSKRSEFGLAGRHAKKPAKRQLHDEREGKSGYLYVKVAMPNKWIPKSRFVYEQSHPDYAYQKNDKFVFLDGDKRNFAAENIGLLRQREALVFQSLGGTSRGNPSETLFHILKARLKVSAMDRAEKAGLTVTNGGGGRFLKSEWEENLRAARKNIKEKK